MTKIHNLLSQYVLTLNCFQNKILFAKYIFFAVSNKFNLFHFTYFHKTLKSIAE